MSSRKNDKHEPGRHELNDDDAMNDQREKQLSRWDKTWRFSLLIGGIAGVVVRYSHSLSTPGWSAAGQSVISRYLDLVTWFLVGFVPTAAAAFVCAWLWFHFGKSK